MPTPAPMIYAFMAGLAGRANKRSMRDDYVALLTTYLAYGAERRGKRA